MTDDARVAGAKAKGRPMLSWVGKRPLREIRALPLQLVRSDQSMSGDPLSLPGDLRERLESAAAAVDRISVRGAFRSTVSPFHDAGEEG